MKFNILTILMIISFSQFTTVSWGQEKTATGLEKSGWLSVGGRSTSSFFDSDGIGIGTGGQFRIQLQGTFAKSHAMDTVYGVCFYSHGAASRVYDFFRMVKFRQFS